MKLLCLCILIMPHLMMAQSQFSKHELSVNGFRNPSIGLEYRYIVISVHLGFYPTIVSKDDTGENETTSFIRAGVTFWFLPTEQGANPSSFYGSLSYVRGLTAKYKGDNGVLIDAGYRWMVWKGLNLRLGAALLASTGHKPKLNPTPGISYSFFWPD